MEWKSSYNRATFFVGLGSLVAGAAIGVAAIRESWKIARESGSLDRPNVAFGFADVGASPPVVDVVVIIPERCSTRPVLMVLPLTIYNRGQKGASDVQAMMNFPLMEGHSPVTKSDLSNLMKSDAPASLTGVSRTVADAGNWRSVTYTIQKLYPRMSVRLGEPVEAPLPISIPASEVIKGAESGEIRVSYAFQIPLVITYDQTQMTTSTISLSVVRAESIKGATKDFQKYIQEKIKNIPQVSPWEGFVRAWIVRPEGEIFVLVPKNLQCDDKRGSFVSQSEAQVIGYELYERKLSWPWHGKSSDDRR